MPPLAWIYCIFYLHAVRHHNELVDNKWMHISYANSLALSLSASCSGGLNAFVHDFKNPLVQIETVIQTGGWCAAAVPSQSLSYKQMNCLNSSVEFFGMTLTNDIEYLGFFRHVCLMYVLCTHFK